MGKLQSSLGVPQAMIPPLFITVMSLGKLLIGPDIKQYSVVFLTVLLNTFIDVFA